MSNIPPSAIPGVETFVITAREAGIDLRISIACPPAGTPGSAAAPSVIYVTDADFCFGTVVDACRLGLLGGELGPAIVVGIGYADETGDLVFSQYRRGLDLYRGPFRTVDIPGTGSLSLGNGDAFLAALLDTVIPEVERRVSEARGARRLLLGVSAGGHFAAHVLTQRPDAFQGYAMMSPALVDFPPTPRACQMVEAVENLPSGIIPTDTHVFLSAGAREEDPADPIAGASIISNIYRMRAALSAKGIVTRLTVFADETHISVLGAAVSRALRFLLPPPQSPT